MTHADIDIRAEYNRGPGRPPGAKNKPKIEPVDTSSGVAAETLRSYVERAESLDEERKAIGDLIKDLFAEMKGTGFDTKAVRAILRIRKQDRSERQEQEAILELYMSALGME